MAVNSGLTWWQAVLISITNVTSAGQVAGVGIMAAGGGLIEMAVTQLVINLRYSLMAISLSQKTDSSMTVPARLVDSYIITDEIFGLASTQEKVGFKYMTGLGVLPVAGWTLGTLLGANRARLKELGTTEYKTFGALKDRSESNLRKLVEQLLSEGYLYQTDDRYQVIRIGNIKPLRDPNTHVLVRFPQKTQYEHMAKERNRRGTDTLTKFGYELFETLRNLRLEIARGEGAPPYIIFNDKTLISMSAKVPRDKSEMLNVPGVSETKYEKFGARFTQAIVQFLNDHPGVATSIEEKATEAGYHDNSSDAIELGLHGRRKRTDNWKRNTMPV